MLERSRLAYLQKKTKKIMSLILSFPVIPNNFCFCLGHGNFNHRIKHPQCPRRSNRLVAFFWRLQIYQQSRLFSLINTSSASLKINILCLLGEK